jgi:general secretion pathway protein M
MMPTLSPGVRRLAALVILLVMVGIVWGGIVGPVVDAWQARSDHREQSLRLLGAYRRATESVPALKAEVADLQQRDRTQHGLLEGASVPLIGAKLQNDIKRIVEAQAGQVASTQALPPLRDGAFEKIAVRVDFRVSTDALAKVAYALEAATPPLLIENVSVRAPETPMPPGKTAPLDLSVRWDVYGYARDVSP